MYNVFGTIWTQKYKWLLMPDDSFMLFINQVGKVFDDGIV